MEDKKENIIRFEMSNLYKFLYYYNGIVVMPCLAVFMFVFFNINGIETNGKLNDTVWIALFIDSIFIFIFLMTLYRVRHVKWMRELFIDKENKKFCLYVLGNKNEISFSVNDITEVGSSPEMFRFFLKDGTWVSWAKDGKSQQSLEEIIKSFGILIFDKKLY